MKTYLLSILYVVLSGTLFAQFEIRPILGMNFSNVSDTPDGTSTQAKLGYQFGGHVMIGNKFHVYPGIAYYRKSTEFTYSSDSNVDIDLDQTSSGIIIPMLVGYRFADPENDPFVNLRVFAGPSISFVTNSEYKDDSVNESVDWKSSVWGAQLGAGLDVSIFFLDATYEFGLSDVHSIDEGSAAFKDVKSNTFFINLGIRLKLAS